MNDIRIPIVDIGMGAGPGSQSTNEDENLDIMNLPSGMDTFASPILPEPEDVEALQRAKGVLDDMLAALRSYRAGEPAITIDLNGLDPQNIDLVNQAMGEGEVSATMNGPAPVLAQESVLAGVWRVQHMNTDKQVLRDTIEIGDIPQFVRVTNDEQKKIDLNFEGHPVQNSNAPPILAEISDQLAQWEPGDEAHVINLTLLPLTEDELLLIGSRLSMGNVTILSRGYGNCRIGSTAINNVWWIKYYNSEDVLILNTIEISDVPSVALAAQEDIDDSAERLDEILELYR